MNAALSALLSNPAIWRGNDCAPEPAALSTGFAELDQVLPGGGWPGNALTEMLLAREGIGELRLTLPTLAKLTREGRDVVWIAPPYRPYAPALAAGGIVLPRLALVRCRDAREALWAFEQALRAPECGAAFAWLSEHDERKLHRLALAAREGRTWGVMWRRPGSRARAMAASLRLGLDSDQGQLSVRVLKRRGSEVAQPIRIDLASRWTTLRNDALPQSPKRMAHSSVAPDPRTSKGRAEYERRLGTRRASVSN
ncbi:MAG TPA: translesion DNA synthesis-associated protein ImuA [Casimicrobiaceae bacterium]|nr:translesion DNA synthesis-associated protein ImuA [Casimicrobiaceae bacterium]